MEKRDIRVLLEGVAIDKVFHIRNGVAEAAITGFSCYAANMINGDSRFIFWAPALVSSLYSTRNYFKAVDDTVAIDAYESMLDGPNNQIHLTHSEQDQDIN
jgi:hypothetical protein